MRTRLVATVLTLLSTPACADHGGEPEGGDESQSTSGGTLETMLLEGPILRGFQADGTGLFVLGDPIVEENSVTFILTDYIAGREGTGIARATCDLGVEIQLPPGITMSLEDVIYSGFTDGLSARSQFFREYVFPGSPVPSRRFTVLEYDAGGVPDIVRDDSDDYAIEFSEFTARDSFLSAVSPCGESATWSANTSLSVRNHSASSFAFLAFDTIWIGNENLVTFRFSPPRPCL